MNNKIRYLIKLRKISSLMSSTSWKPLHSPYIMGKMAYAAYLGGAKGIRANGIEDIKEKRWWTFQ